MTEYRSCPGIDWQLDVSSRELLHEGRRTRLPEKPFRVLMALLDTPGEVVTRATLQRRLWPDDTFVDFDNNLNTAVASLRQALGDSARAPQFIETLPRLGYRLMLPPGCVADAAVTTRRAAGPRYNIGLLALAAAITIATFTAVFAFWPARTPLPDIAALATDNPKAETMFARGQYLRGQYMSANDRPDLLVEARQAFRAAAEADPTFAEAIAEEAETVVDMSFAGAVGLPMGLSEARELAKRAVTIDKNTAAAHRVLGMTKLFLDWDVRSAARSLETAEQLQPAEARTAMARATWASILGRHDDAITSARRAVALEPGSYYVRADLAFYYLAAGRNAEAATSSRDVLSVNPSFLPALTYSLTANERLGRWAEAATAARALMQSYGAPVEDLRALAALPPREAVRSWRRWDLGRLQALAAGRTDEFSLELALKSAAAGEHGAALDYLERAHARRSAMLVFLRAYPELAGLRGDPRFEAIASAVSNAGTGVSAG